ncbi:TetR/AcrR family transcriptional regulator [Gordonia sp. (in: high G+C Gram-positive bacteria)]|uniref:TetR/AcrR family transcriptional regulator n=1 Tax=unclassified Gordonia (in: high G+C Gram-positive bacteria) TaxID=2657482 RepID=UPI00262802EE|nr:TetR/AcrR family transcriptional regulator [Gordonia sp. (in: high G+C Gram-positive bacteria)]
MTQDAPRPSRRGRPRTGEVAARKSAMLDAAAALLVERGYPSFTVNAVAERTGASKSTIYSWFGNREALVSAIAERNYDLTQIQVHASSPTEQDPREVLTAWTHQLLRVLHGDLSLAILRAAMNEPALGPVVLRDGADRQRPLLAAYLADASRAGLLRIDDAPRAAKELYGLVVQDDQMRALLGDARMTPDALRVRADQAVANFLRIYGP